MPFVSLGLVPSLATPLARRGYATPTPVQAAAIPVILEGRDVFARAQTGTGKTAAFGLPMIQRLFATPSASGPTVSRQPRGLVLVPTRELALQVYESLLAYGAPLRLRVAAIFGGVSFGPQQSALSRGVDIVVATPGRLIDHLGQRTVDLSRIEILVLDEADRMLDMGFLPPLRRILAVLPTQRQTLLLSATLAPEVQELAASFTRDPAQIDVTPKNTVAVTVSHYVHYVTQDNKRALLTHILQQPDTGQTLVFCRTKHGSNRVGRQLEVAGIKVGVIHGNKSQNARVKALTDFKSGRVEVLVATDVAARGLDIAQLPLVINYDLPLVAADYVHRIGRTGRAGAPGRAISLVAADEAPLLRDIQKLLSAPLEQMNLPGFETPAFAIPSGDSGGYRGRPQRPGRSQGQGRGGGGGRPSREPSRGSHGSPRPAGSPTARPDGARPPSRRPPHADQGRPAAGAGHRHSQGGERRSPQPGTHRAPGGGGRRPEHAAPKA
ncbi:DEAD/DEAH box helicase [Haliangium sp. UPWRP_2]|uniref:DEAD/DEAH box helicase n=1 Tax=Haliangium sp. UPWRP_2 TaxID=1931276 RepID=UPI000B539E0B|nr:DEAD/DEAH box helicase [Haliangium sp. UPWRP_2]PSM32261.1 ATP-dependent helicase [Haliangium sp. UPWRP_2]